MKKFIMRSSFALVMCCLLFAACSKDDNTDVNTASVTGYWVCYYQCWSEDGETWESNYNGDDYYINFSSHLADGKYEGDILSLIHIYILQGNLLYQAFIQAYNDYVSH